MSKHCPADAGLSSKVRDLFYLIQIRPVAFGFHVVAMDEPQRGRVDTIAQATPINRAIVKHMPKMTIAMRERTSVRVIPCALSRNSLTLADSIGLVKLGQPTQLYLSDEANKGSPDTMST